MGKRTAALVVVVAFAILMMAGVSMALGATVPYDGTECAECHSSGGGATDPVFSVPAVDYSTACAKCHWESAGSHPFHNATWNCGSCHPGMGFVDPSAVPLVSTANGDFNTAASANAPSWYLHSVHAAGSWPADVTKNGRQCGSCHAPAACNVCHTGIDPKHTEHAYLESGSDYWLYGPDGTRYGAGTTPGNELENSTTNALTCSNDTCHPAPEDNMARHLVENRDASVVYTGSWGRSGTSGYTANSYSIAIAAGARSTLTFNGEKVDVISDLHPYRGNARIWIDGVATATVDLYAASTQKQVVVWESGQLTPGEHTVAVEVLGTKNAASKAAYVVVDAFRLYPTTRMPKQDCLICHEPDTHTGQDVFRSTDHGEPAAPAHTATATAWTSVTTTSTVRANVACESLCHTPRLGEEHASVIPSTSPATINDGAFTCAECHATPEYTANGGGTPGYQWTGDCSTCHVRHDAIVPKHNWTATSAGCAGTGCHEIARIDRIHYNATATIAPAGAVDNCNVCHLDDGKPKGMLNGGAPATDCEDCHVGHAAAHAYTAASQYSQSALPDSESGCANSGTGCHSSAAAGDAASTFHASTGCLTGACHTSATMDQTWKDGGSGAECSRCHDGTFAGADDMIALSDPRAIGHYGESTHTPTSMASTVTAGGTYTATCSTCHDATDAGGIDGLYYQHSGLATAQVSAAANANLSCSECHNRNAAITAEVTGKDWDDTCADCHNGADLPGYTQHGTTAPSVTGTEAAGAGTCQTSGCHTTTDLHELHKSNVTGNPNGCTMSGCHDTTKQGWKPTATSCGSGGDCHTGTVHPGEAAAHTTLSSSECVDCHESGDLKTVHSNSCSTCHGNATYPSLPTGKLECTSCHTSGTVANARVGSGGNYTYHDPTHYVGSESTHTSDGADTGFSNTDGHSCVSCHKLNIKVEHYKSSTDTSTMSAYDTTCVGCHELEVDGLGGAWNDRCVACHTTGSTHTGFDAVHNAPASWDTACGGGGCHDTDNVDVIHKNSVSGNATVTTCVNTCHANNDTLPTSVNCDTSGCHGGAGHGHSLDTTGSAGCYSTGAGCHNSSSADYASTDYHPDNGCTSGACHAASNRGDAKYDNPNSCADCHDGSYNGAPDTTPTVTPTGGHYSETTHTASSLNATMVAFSGGTITAACSACHDPGDGAGASRLDGYYNQHQNLRAGVGSLTCSGCHNKNASIQTIVTDATRDDACTDCHTSGIVEVAHNSSVAPSVTASEAAGAGSCQTTGCHTTLNLHELHRGTASTPATRSALGCAFGGCHDYNAQGIKPTQKTCGAGGACHTTDAHDANAHDTTVQGDTGGCVDCHEYSDIRTVHGNDCSTCHNGGSNLGGSGGGNTADCIDCHNNPLEAGDVYYDAGDTPMTKDHYDSNVTTHTEAATGSITTQSWGTTSYGVRLDRFYTGGTSADTTGHAYEVDCDTCHTTDLFTEHTKTTIDFDLQGHGDVCIACHQIVVDGWSGTAWDKNCGGNNNGCHDVDPGGNLHQTAGSGWNEKHNASSWSLTTPGSASTQTIGGGGPTPAGAGALGPGFSDGFESNNFSNWTTVDQAGVGGWASVWTDGFESNNFGAWTSASNRWAVQGTTVDTGSYAAWVDGSTSESLLTKTGLNLSAGTGARVTFRWRQNLAENSDAFELQTTTNGSTWNTVANYLSASQPTAYTTVTETLGTNVVGIRFRVQTNIQGGNDQVYLDNVNVEVNMPASAGGWNVQTAQKSAGTYAARAVGTGPQWYDLTKTGIDNSNATSVDVSYAIRWDNLEAADDVVVQYTTNGGGAWTDIKNYAPAGADPASQTWKTETFTGLPAGINGIRFRLYADNSTGDLLYIDAVTVTPQSSAGGQTADSCMNNPNGYQCHNVTDVADIHSKLANNGCPTCHTGTSQHPTIKNCQNTGCHPNVNIDEHDGHHDTNFVSASFDTAFSRSWCEACHIGAGGTSGVDGIDDEHEVLDAFHDTPCSVCHKKQTNTGGAAPVTSANTTGTIATRTKGTAICDDCHKTFTKERPHVQRRHVYDNTTNTNKQFTATTAMTGHRVYTTNDRDTGAGVQWFIDNNGPITAWEGYTIGTPTLGRWLAGTSPWNTEDSLVTCNACHAGASSPTAPHAGTMSMNIDPSYPGNYQNATIDDVGTTNGMLATNIICAKCHNLEGGGNNVWSNNVHSEHAGRGNNGGYCTHCHPQVPHQSTHIRMLGLIGEDATSLRTGGLTGISPHNETPTGWSTGDCGADCSTSRHPYSGTDW